MLRPISRLSAAGHVRGFHGDYVFGVRFWARGWGGNDFIDGFAALSLRQADAVSVRSHVHVVGLRMALPLAWRREHIGDSNGAIRPGDRRGKGVTLALWGDQA